MAPSQKEYFAMPKTPIYKHKKFGNRVVAHRNGYKQLNTNTNALQTSDFNANTVNKEIKATTECKPRLFRPYALNDNTPRKRRISELQQDDQYESIIQKMCYEQQQQLQFQQRQQQQKYLYSYQQYDYPWYDYQQNEYQQYPFEQSIKHPAFIYAQTYYAMPHVPAPTLDHQAFAMILQKQRNVLQIRQMMNINPDINTWPLEWRKLLDAMLN